MTTANPYQAPASDLTQGNSNHPYQPTIFTTEGRIGRLRYLAYGVILLMPTSSSIGDALNRWYHHRRLRPS
ncbi:MAG: hypothetical protein ACJA2E_001410 [Arenicella sp.]|jgi:hypothetical protein